MRICPKLATPFPQGGNFLYIKKYVLFAFFSYKKIHQTICVTSSIISGENRAPPRPSHKIPIRSRLYFIREHP